MAKEIAKAANDKPKAFFKKISENFDEGSRALVAGKVLLHSRNVEIDKIAEVIGGKEQVALDCLAAFLERQDYSDKHIEHRLRSFMKTFRMAGVESQVIFRILEQYGHKAFEMDPETCFADKQEYYDFSYMLIVLHTQQHNKAIKQKSNLALFQGQAKEMVPKSYDNLPADLVESCFQKITEKEIKAPVSRNLLVSAFDFSEMSQEIRLRQIRQEAADS